MASGSIIDSFAFAGGLAFLAAAITGLMLRARILAVPNERSSHAHPVPSSGGVAIVITTCFGVAAAYFTSPYLDPVSRQLLGLGVASLLIAGFGLLDDLGRLTGFRSKLAVQILACAVLLASGVVMESVAVPILGEVVLGAWGYPLTAAWVVGLTNVFNFMDGLDGMAAGTAVIVATIFGLICLGEGAVFSHILCLVLSAACLGMLVFNFPKARIFMGDVGSQFLGFVLAAVAVISAEYDASRLSILVMPLLLFNFIFDTVFTFIRRLWAGENVTRAHRSHLYQLMNQLGFSHAQVSMSHFGMAVAQGAVAFVFARGAGTDAALAFLPLLLFQLVYAGCVLRATCRRGRA